MIASRFALLAPKIIEEKTHAIGQWAQVPLGWWPRQPLPVRGTWPPWRECRAGRALREAAEILRVDRALRLRVGEDSRRGWRAAGAQGGRRPQIRTHPLTPSHARTRDRGK